MTSVVVAYAVEVSAMGSRAGAGTRRRVHVTAIVPCYDRARDAAQVLSDLARVERRVGGGAVELRVVLVDNGSARPLSGLRTPGLDLHHLRLHQNTGGSGGYNAGMDWALSGERGRGSDFDSDFLWLVDSDARVAPDTLTRLMEAMESDSTIIAAGAALADPLSGQVFEVGGVVNKSTGALEAAVAGGVAVDAPGGVVECEYVATCCALVRAAAVRACGGMPDRFLNADDAEWFIRMRQRTGGRVVAVPRAIALHPRFDRFPTWTRYYTTRNALAPLSALGLSRRVRVRRAASDALRAGQQALSGREDLSALHIAGLRDAARGRTSGAAAKSTMSLERGETRAGLRAAIEEALSRAGADRRIGVAPSVMREEGTELARIAQAMNARVVVLGEAALGWNAIARAAGRWIVAPRLPVAIVPARARAGGLWVARRIIQLDGANFVVRRTARVRSLMKAGAAVVRGLVLAHRAAARDGVGPSDFDRGNVLVFAGLLKAPSTLEIIVLSYNRWGALERTLRGLLADPWVASTLASGECGITVVDNGSTDGTPERIRSAFPRVGLIALERNIGVEAFNHAARASDSDILLILDDDALPAPGAIAAAMARLERNLALAAVTLHPHHPASKHSEWPFARGSPGDATDAWPVMGCANFVRRSDWLAAGGYVREYFLYRNDMDLALTLLSRGRGVHFDPALVVWHDSPSGPGARKSIRWHRMATRNWVWMARRHGRGWGAVLGGLMGVARAAMSARFSPARQWATLTGATDGMRTRPPATHACELECAAPGHGWVRYLELRLRCRLHS